MKCIINNEVKDISVRGILDLIIKNKFDGSNIYNGELDDNIAYQLISKNIENFYYFKNPSFKIIKYAITKEPSIIKYLKDEYKTANNYLLLLKINYKIYDYIEDSFKNNLNFIKSAIRVQQSLAIDILFENMDKRHIVKEVLKVYPECIKYIEQPDDDLLFMVIRADYQKFKYINKRDKNFLMKALSINPRIMKYINTRDIDIIKKAIRLYDLNIDVVYQNEEICEYALNISPNLFQYMKINNENINRLAVKLCGANIQYISRPSLEVCRLSLTSDIYNFSYINKIARNRELFEMAIKINPISIQWITQTYELCKLAVSINPDSLKYIRNQAYSLCKLAVSRKSDTIKYVKNQTEELCKISLNGDINNIKYIKDQDKYYKLAINKDPRVIRFFKIQTNDIIKYAILRDINVLRYVYRKDEELLEFLKLNFKDEVLYKHL